MTIALAPFRLPALTRRAVQAPLPARPTIDAETDRAAIDEFLSRDCAMTRAEMELAMLMPR